MLNYFSQPLWLLLFPPIAYLLWRMQRNSFSDATPLRMKLWLVIRLFLLGVLLFGLAGFQLKTLVRKSQIVFLIDLSASVTTEQKEKALYEVNRFVESVRSPDQVGMVVFGGEAAVERFPSTPRPFEKIESEIDPAATDFENATRLADSLFSADSQKNLILISDGLENTGDADASFSALKEKRVSLQSLYLPAEIKIEAAIEMVRVPDEIKLNQKFSLEIVTSSNAPMHALMQIFRNGAIIQEGTVRLSAKNKEVFQLPQQIDRAGLYRYEVRLRPENDFHSENNFQEAWVTIAGPPRVLLIDANPEELRHLQQALKNHGFATELKGAGGFPRTIEEMLLYSALFVRNIPATRIHDQMDLLKQYTRDFGGGFVMLGGEDSFGPGGYFETPVEELLPVAMDLRNKEYLADVAMVIVIDKSGSMSYAERGRQKIDLADEGGARVVSLLKSSDSLGVLAVDSVPKWAFPLQQLKKKQQAIDAITSIRASGGGIYVYSGLREAYRALAPVKATIKHVILFADTADCEEKDGPLGDSSFYLAKRALDEYKITTTTIGIGQTGDVDVEYLQKMAAIANGRFYFTNDMFTLPEIFTKESALVQRYYINEERFTPAFADPEPVLNGINTVPDLLGYVATSHKNRATVALITPRKDPVLAFWRFGLGQSAAFTSDPTALWGRLWLDWPEYQRFWVQLARLVTRESAPANFRTSFSAYQGRTNIVVEAIDKQGMLLNDALFSGVLVDSKGTQHRPEFSQTAAGRYEAELPVRSTLFGKIFRHQNGKILEESVVQFNPGPSREYERNTNGFARLEQLTGKVLKPGEKIEFVTGLTEDVQSLQHQLIFLAAFLFLFDVAARKIDFRTLKLFEKKTITESQPVSPLVELKHRKRKTATVQTIAIPEIPVVKQEATENIEEKQPEKPDEYMQRLKAAKKKSV